MRRILLALFAALTLAGCVSSIEDAYDDQAKSECDRAARSGWDRADCYDRVDQYRREHRF